MHAGASIFVDVDIVIVRRNRLLGKFYYCYFILIVKVN
jgi:hypothetical protein